MAFTPIPHRFFEQSRRRPAWPAYFTKEGGQWNGTDWRTYAAVVRQAGKAMMALGIRPGATVCILGFTRPEWAVFDVAAMAIGGVPAGIYTTNSPEECQYILNHAEATLLLVENEDLFEKIRKIRGCLPSLKHVVTMRRAPAIDDPLVMSWDAFLAKGDRVGDGEFEARMSALEPGGLAKLIYTSGTTGPPKGVMLSHANIAWVGDILVQMADWEATDRTISFLPLSHIAEQNMTIHGAATAGSPVYFAESLQALPENLKEVQPTIFLAVPRVWEKLHGALRSAVTSATGFKKGLLRWAMRVGARANKLRMEGREPAGRLGLQVVLAEKLVFSKVKSAVGMSRVRMCVSGAAPIAVEILEFLASLDVLVNEVYGLSETTGGISFNRAGAVRFGSVGTALPGVEFALADDGEILARGPNVFLGYYKSEEATRESFADGWLLTGDVGRVDPEGYLYIVDRKKHIIITSGGKNITPANIENEIQTKDPIIGHVHVHGDRRPYVTALLTVDPLKALEWAEANGLLRDPETGRKIRQELLGNPQARSEGLSEWMREVTSHPELRKRIARAVREANEKLSRVEQVKRVYLLDRDPSIAEGEVTPTLKVKRKKLERKFAPVFDRLYEDASFGIVIMER